MNGRPYILLVDDDPAIREATGDLLEAEGYEVGLAANGLLGLQQVRERRPDVILLDLMMPVMDGWAFCAALKSERLEPIPIVLLSAVRNLAENARQLALPNFIGKPYDVEQLIGLLDRVLTTSAA